MQPAPMLATIDALRPNLVEPCLAQRSLRFFPALFASLVCQQPLQCQLQRAIARRSVKGLLQTS